MSFAVTAIAQSDVVQPATPTSTVLGKRTTIRTFYTRDEAEEYKSRIVGSYWQDVRVERQ